ncbi:MAG: hypothetical protein QOJ21_893, partial [Solirubrobacteraceae bacterium]|nr:hypothetical protein [Solirubrobacteraceae bacterium]
EMHAVLDRVAAHGDLFAAVLAERQELRLPRGLGDVTPR